WELTGANLPAFDDDIWELYDITKDWTQADDLSKTLPDKLHELQRLWLIEATRHNVLPLDDRGIERFIAEIAGRPELIKGNSQLIFPGMVLGEANVVNIKNKSHSVTAEVEIDQPGVTGVIVAQGANFGGWALYAHEGKLKYVYNFIGMQTYEVEASEALPVGKHQVRMEFKYDGGGLGQGGVSTLYVDGAQVAEGRIEHTHAIIFSADSTLMVGNKTGAPISKDFGRKNNSFTGKVNWANIEVGEDTQEHLIDPEEWVRVHMSIQ
ncbi:MAG: arylsulfatase, partial [Euryarchaeota archaeon]|nr:arylsulfatase [Euryarchaeota archaeon]